MANNAFCAILLLRRKAVHRMVKRTEYLDELKKWQDKDVIKVVTGIRRCGKSTLLALFQEELKLSGITEDQILSLNFENIAYENLLDYKALY